MGRACQGLQPPFSLFPSELSQFHMLYGSMGMKHPRRGELRDSTEAGSCQVVGRKRVGRDCLMGRGGCPSWGMTVIRNQVETAGVPHRKRTQCHRAAPSKALVLPMSLISVERRQDSLVIACFSVCLLHSATPSPPLHPLCPRSPVFLGGKAGEGFEVLFHTLRGVLAPAFTSSPDGMLRVPPSSGACEACSAGHRGWTGTPGGLTGTSLKQTPSSAAAQADGLSARGQAASALQVDTGSPLCASELSQKLSFLSSHTSSVREGSPASPRLLSLRRLHWDQT